MHVYASIFVCVRVFMHLCVVIDSLNARFVCVSVLTRALVFVCMCGSA